MAGFTENSRLSNERMIGNNVKLFEALKAIIAVNDGTRECVTRAGNCFDKQAPIPFDKYTKNNLTAEEWDMCSIRSGFLTLKCEHKIQLVKRTGGGFDITDTIKLNSLSSL
jgi:hypothetical protein